MSNGFLEVIELRPTAGREPLVVLAILAPAGAVSVHLAQLPGRWILVAWLALAVATLLELRVALADGPAALGARLLPDGRWQLAGAGAGGAPVAAHLARAWGASLGPVVGLEWACEDGRKRRAWLLQRDLPARDWRRLRVRLRLA